MRHRFDFYEYENQEGGATTGFIAVTDMERLETRNELYRSMALRRDRNIRMTVAKFAFSAPPTVEIVNVSR